MFKLDLEKAEEPEMKLSTSAGLSKGKRGPEKHLFLLYWLCQSLWLCGLSQHSGTNWNKQFQQTVENSSRDGDIRSPDLPFENMQVRKQQLELDMEQQTGSKLGEEYDKAVHCHPAYWTYMQATSYEMLGWMKHKLESRLPGEISITSDMQMTPPLWQKARKN